MNEQDVERHPAESLRTVGFTLHPWQLRAVEAWCRGDDGRTYRGTLDIFTGGGKTLIALTCMQRAFNHGGALKAAIVVPTIALAHQWRQMILEHTNLLANEVGLLGGGSRDSLSDHRLLICVLASAARRLPDMTASAEGVVLFIDECHRAGAPEYSRVLTAKARFSLGLSATPARDELDENGEPLDFDEQLVGQALGPVVFRFGLKEAREGGWLPEFQISHHAVQLTSREAIRYERISRQVEDLANELEGLGGDPLHAAVLMRRTDDLGRAATRYTVEAGRRKDLLYRASERTRIAELVLSRELNVSGSRAILFHERVSEAEALYKRLRKRWRSKVALEHSKLPASERRRALQGFSDGSIRVLVSVKSLIEGIDVPEADVGVSVASASSVRQRIQSLGRVLRRLPEAASKRSRMHVIYVRETVDVAIYAKANWTDLTGVDTNIYLRWPLGESEPVREPGPPIVPPATEEEEWVRLGRRPPDVPVEWRGEIPDHEYSIDTTGNVTSASGAVITNWGEVAEMLARLDRSAGRFFVTPSNRLVLAFRQRIPFVIGQLAQSRRFSDERVTGDCPEFDTLHPGVLYYGPLDRAHGTFKVASARGGVIAKRVGRSTLYALVDGTSTRAQNARSILDAWKEAVGQGIEFQVNSCWHAWCYVGGNAKFLASVPGGFEWPTGETS